MTENRDVARNEQPGWHGEVLALVTASLTIEFTGTAEVGDWLEARTTLRRMGSRLAFAGCEITCGDRLVVCASGVFSVPPRRAEP